MAVVNKLFGRRKSDAESSSGEPRRSETRKAEPDYVVTSQFDGSKSVDLNKFIEDKEIKRQIRDRVKRHGQGVRAD